MDATMITTIVIAMYAIMAAVFVPTFIMAFRIPPTPAPRIPPMPSRRRTDAPRGYGSYDA